jgi:hypothetical protein
MERTANSSGAVADDIHEVNFPSPKLLAVDECDEVEGLWLEVVDFGSKKVVPGTIGSDVGGAVRQFSLGFSRYTEGLCGV